MLKYITLGLAMLMSVCAFAQAPEAVATPAGAHQFRQNFYPYGLTIAATAAR